MKNILSKIATFFLLLPSTVFAQTQTPSGTGIKSAFNVAEQTASSSYNTTRNLDLVLGDIILIILSSIGTVFVIFIIYAGYLWMTASGNEQKVDKSIQILKQSIIGLIIVIGAYAISYFVIQIFGSQLTQ
jgi:hypothetical protein